MKRIIGIVAVSVGAAFVSSAQDITNICVTVPSGSSGIAVGNVVAGQTYNFTASGCVEHNLDGAFNDPSGRQYSDNCANFVGESPIAGSAFLCPGLTAYSLVGKITGGSCVQLGTNGNFLASASGQLTLYFNDDIYGDNTGSWSACITSGSPPPPPIVVTNFCGPMDVVLVVDDTGSMGPAIANIRVALANIIAAADAASGGDVRFGVVTFGVGVEVNRPLSCQVNEVISTVNGLGASGGDGEPEDSDAALRYVVTGAAGSTCTVSEPRGPLGEFRPHALKIAVLVTDSRPGGCDDQYDDGVDDVQAAQVASLAAAEGVLISAILVNDGSSFITSAHPGGVEEEVMQTYASVSGGFYTTVPSSGDGAGNSIAEIIANCGGGSSSGSSCVTRPATFWFTHPSSTDSACVTLKKSLEACAGADLGFLTLPLEHRTPDFVKDAEDAMIEALGLYWRSPKKTGENRGLQSLKLPGSRLCQARKALAVELLAASANAHVLGAIPGNCTYLNGAVVTNFPPDLLQQGRVAGRSDDLSTIAVTTALLRKFNSSGQTNNFPIGLVECSGMDRKALRDLARDPTTQQSCPGINDTCESAQPVVFQKSANIFSQAKFAGKASLTRYTDDFPLNPSCGVGGADAVWKIAPAVALPGRAFTVVGSSSNLRPLVSVWSTAGSGCSNLLEVICGIDTNNAGQAIAKFRSDGTNTYYVVLEPENGTVGSLKLRVTSP